jgi:CheY-like chemotaxis protein
VLVVEDNPDIREVFRDALEIEGVPVMTACNGREGLAALQNISTPCLILLDLMMPIMNGYEFLEALVQRPDHDRFGVWIVSAEFDMEDRVASAPGVLGFIPKPCDLADIVSAVHGFHPN